MLARGVAPRPGSGSVWGSQQAPCSPVEGTWFSLHAQSVSSVPNLPPSAKYIPCLRAHRQIEGPTCKMVPSIPGPAHGFPNNQKPGIRNPTKEIDAFTDLASPAAVLKFIGKRKQKPGNLHTRMHLQLVVRLICPRNWLIPRGLSLLQLKGSPEIIKRSFRATISKMLWKGLEGAWVA